MYKYFIIFFYVYINLSSDKFSFNTCCTHDFSMFYLLFSLITFYYIFLSFLIDIASKRALPAIGYFIYYFRITICPCDHIGSLFNVQPSLTRTFIDGYSHRIFKDSLVRRRESLKTRREPPQNDTIWSQTRSQNDTEEE